MKTQIFDTIDLEVDRMIVTVKLNRPDRLNALNVTMIEELTEAFRMANSDRSVSVVIMTGSGDRAFCSGADLTQEQLGESGRYEQYLTEFYHPLLRSIVESPKPYIAALNGLVVGAGIGLALACDYILAAPEVEFHMAFVRIGLVPDTGVMSFVTNHIGRQKAFDWVATGGIMSAEEALKTGLINGIAEKESLTAELKKKANAYANMPSTAVGLIKQMSHAASTHSLEEMLALEKNLQERAAAQPDHMEGVRAFLEKRSPNFNR